MSKYTKNHTVYHNNSGIEVPSVTTILKLLNKPALVHWSNYLGFKRQNVKAVLEESASKGTSFHDIVHKHTTKEHLNITDYTKDVQNLFNLFQIWYTENDFSVTYGELSLSGNKFAGTIDAIGILNGNMIILDYKTSKNIYPSMFLQLSAYSLLIKENRPDLYTKLDGVGILSISEKNGIQEKYIPIDKIEKLYQPTFNSLVDIFYKWYDLNIEDWDINITKE